MAFRNATVADYQHTHAPDIIRSSYKNVAFPMGCSISELEVALGDGEFVLENAAVEVAGFVRIKTLVADNCYIDLFVIEPPQVAPLLQGFLDYLAQEYGVDKFYAQVLAQESVEIEVLESLGFREEARLREHVFIDGRYRDLLMMGSMDNRV